jgi:hypothetical protein
LHFSKAFTRSSFYYKNSNLSPLLFWSSSFIRFLRTHTSYLNMNRQRSLSRRKPRLAIIQLWLFPPFILKCYSLFAKFLPDTPSSRLGQPKP